MSSTFDAQAAFAQVTGRLDAMQTSQLQIQQILLQAVDIQTGMLDGIRQMQGDVRELKSDVRELAGGVRELKNDVQQLRDSHLTLLRVQNQVLDYMKFTFDQQAKWNERQDQFNIIFLDELRDLKREVRQRDINAQRTGDKMYQEIKSRIGRLEDFLNDQLGKAS